mmetsp:Transcript_33324/g.54161  ORF Transcript_33324/g.54161 Transcript_33324/m.54161 type:complete len:245 (-) Transcript_33324:654-1388(-)
MLFFTTKKLFFEGKTHNRCARGRGRAVISCFWLCSSNSRGCFLPQMIMSNVYQPFRLSGVHVCQSLHRCALQHVRLRPPQPKPHQVPRHALWQCTRRHPSNCSYAERAWRDPLRHVLDQGLMHGVRETPFDVEQENLERGVIYHCGEEEDKNLDLIPRHAFGDSEERSSYSGESRKHMCHDHSLEGLSLRRLDGFNAIIVQLFQPAFNAWSYHGHRSGNKDRLCRWTVSHCQGSCIPNEPLRDE